MANTKGKGNKGNTTVDAGESVRKPRAAAKGAAAKGAAAKGAAAKGAAAKGAAGKRVVANKGAYVQRYRANYANGKQVAVHADVGSKVKWLCEANPKRDGSASHARFAKYFGATTVEAYLAKGGTRADLRWEAQHGFLQVVPAKA